MKGKVFYVVFFAIILSLISIIPIVSASAKTDESKSEKGKIIIKYTAPETDWDSATSKEKETLKEIGWELEDGVLVQYRSVSEEIDQAVKDGFLPSEDEMERNTEFEEHDNDDNTLIVDGEKTEINDGRFEVEGEPEKIEVESDENSKETIKKDENGEYQVVLEQNLNKIIGDMDEHGESHDESGEHDIGLAAKVEMPPHGSKVFKYGDPVHCNRFNGPKSNNKHLKKSSPQGLINFYHSDCDYGALKYCKAHNKCNQKYRAAYCSHKQGHYTKYHKH